LLLLLLCFFFSLYKSLVDKGVVAGGLGGLQPPRVGQNDFFGQSGNFSGPKNCQIAPDFSGKIDSAPPEKIGPYA